MGTRGSWVTAGAAVRAKGVTVLAILAYRWVILSEHCVTKLPLLRIDRAGCGGRVSYRGPLPSDQEVQGPVNPLDDVWFTRDLLVLRAIARLVDAPTHGGAPYLGQVVPASGLAKSDVVAAARALVSAGYVEALTNYAGEIVRFTGISPEARRLAGLWPTPQGEWDRLLEQLTARAENAPTDVERQRWRAMAAAAGTLGPDDGALLMAALIGGYVPRRH